MPSRLAPLLAAAVMLSGCQVVVPFSTAPSRADSSRLVRLEGVMAYRERIALPPDSIAIVTLADISRPDIPAEVIARTRFPTQGRQVPIAFTLDYDPARLVAQRYAVRAQIEDAAGALLWTTDAVHELPPAGERISLPLVSARR